MNVAIIGGNERMERRYIDICKSYEFDAKVFTKVKGIRNKIGKPDMLILFTNTISHKMVTQALNYAPKDVNVVRVHSSSIRALKEILDNYAGGNLNYGQ